MGCYGLYKTGQWIYVGKGDTRTRLLAHLNNHNPCITPQWTGQNRPFVDTANPAISGARDER